MEEHNEQIIDIIKEYKKMKADYIRIVESKLYDKW